MHLPLIPKTNKADQKRLILRFTLSFDACKASALQCRNRGDIEGARFWATQSRADWRCISEWLAAA